MSALANFTMPSFFDDIPFSAKPAACGAWDAIRESRSVMVDGFYIAFCAKLEADAIIPPPRHEFVEWFRKVRAGAAPRPFSPHIPETVQLQFTSSSPQVDCAMKAYDIIKKAVELQRSMIASGYSPDSVEMENQIVAEAIKDWLKSEAGDWSEAMNLDYTPGEIAMQLLSGKDSGQNAKLLDVFAMHMQRELALAIVDGRGKGGAA